MFKNKRFLLGMSLGLIVSAILMQLMYTVESVDNRMISPEGVASKEITMDDVKQFARINGLTIVSKDEPLYTKEQVEEAKQKALAEFQKQLPDVTESKNKPHKKAVYIEKGLDSSEVAAKLLEFGIIQDSNKFIEQLTLQKLSSKIQFDYYEFEGNPDLQDVIKKITIK